MTLRSADFESAASASSTTSAYPVDNEQKKCDFIICKRRYKKSIVPLTGMKDTVILPLDVYAKGCV